MPKKTSYHSGDWIIKSYSIKLQHHRNGELMRILTLLLLTISLVALVGCGGDPVKPAGPGGTRMQPYNAPTGTYK